jgi:hypothetical protein
VLLKIFQTNFSSHFSERRFFFLGQNILQIPNFFFFPPPCHTKILDKQSVLFFWNKKINKSFYSVSHLKAFSCHNHARFNVWCWCTLYKIIKESHQSVLWEWNEQNLIIIIEFLLDDFWFNVKRALGIITVYIAGMRRKMLLLFMAEIWYENGILKVKLFFCGFF